MFTSELYKKLHRELSYCSITGVLKWKNTGTGRKDRAGWTTYDGYRALKINLGIVGECITILEHRAIWFMCTGFPPKNEIDHINRIRDDNRISNLRDVTASVNSQNKGLYKNNKSGHVGVTYRQDSNKWRATMSVNGKRKTIGCFNNMEDAIAAKLKALDALVA